MRRVAGPKNPEWISPFLRAQQSTAFIEFEVVRRQRQSGRKCGPVTPSYCVGIAWPGMAWHVVVDGGRGDRNGSGDIRGRARRYPLAGQECKPIRGVHSLFRISQFFSCLTYCSSLQKLGFEDMIKVSTSTCTEIS